MHRFPRLGALVLVLAAVLCVGATPSQAPPQPPSDLDRIAAWLTGDFDNFQQYYEEKETKAPQSHERMHASIAPVAAAGLGPHAVLVRESAPNEPDRVAGLHVYVLEPAPGGGGEVRLRVYAVTDPAVLAGILADPKKPVALAPAQLAPVPDSTLTWRRDGDAFVGSGPAPGPDRRPRVTRAYRLTADELSFAERVTDAAGAVVSGRADAAPFRLMRARLFNCYAAILREGTTDKYDSMLNVLMHDQGKWVTFVDEAGKVSKYSFELSQLRYNQKVPVMKLALYEAGKEAAFAYTWAETTSQKIGINLRWFQVGCSIK